ncbi:MAG: hypothetical protein J6X31_00020 [Bacteroidales bacterium]|nr:hypothetical protein [Bacteroidales bacterium]
MKRIHLYLILLLALCASCTDRHYNMNTEVHPDGTCSRELWFKADSATMTGTPTDRVKDVRDLFADDQWVKTIAPLNESALCSYPMSQILYDSLQAQIDSQDSVRYRLCDTLRIYARRDFATVQQMAEAMPFTLAGQSLRTTATLQSHFRWFYTDYIYPETFPSLASLFRVPITNYMDEQMASFWLTGTPNPFRHMPGMVQADYFEKLTKDFWKWVFANRANDLVDILVDGYDSIANPSITKTDLLAHKQEFIDRMAQTDIGDFNVLDDQKTRQLAQDVFHGDIFTLITPPLEAKWNQRSAIYEDILTFHLDYRLTPPGEIIQVNECSENLEYRDGALQTSLTGLSLLDPHYTIRATSTVRNGWAFLLTWIIALLAIALCLLPLFRKGKTEE